MLKYDTKSLLEDKYTYYELVVAVAKRARTIAEQAELENTPLDEKPVGQAVDELQAHKTHIRRNPVED